MTKRRFAAEPRRFWTPEEDAILRARFPHEPTAVVAAALGRTVGATHGRAHALGMEKSEGFRNSHLSGRLLKGDERGASTRFQPGQQPPNKGKPRPAHWKPIPATTQFKKGSLNGFAKAHLRPIGAERISKDGYLERKTHADIPPDADRREAARLRQRRWRQVHRIVWEEAYGPVPPGHMVTFKNGDKRDIRLDNLELVSQADWMRRNTIHNLPPELKQTVQLLGRVNRQIRKRTNDASEKQDR